MTLFSIRLLALILMLAVMPKALPADTVIILQNNYGPQAYGFRFVTSDPYNYQKLSTPPDEVSITFTQPVDAEESSIAVYDLFGRQINDEALIVEENSMKTALPPLSRGRYKVKWKAQCRCAGRQRLNDVFRFTLR